MWTLFLSIKKCFKTVNKTFKRGVGARCRLQRLSGDTKNSVPDYTQPRLHYYSATVVKVANFPI